MILKWLSNEYKRHYSIILKNVIARSRICNENIRFKDCHTGKRCFIVGSGHSINSQDLSRLKNEIVITQNHFHAHHLITDIEPTYHVVVPKYQEAEYDSNWREWMNGMNERLPSDTITFFGSNSKYLVDSLNIFKNRSFYISTGLSNVVRRKAPVDITKPIFAVPTVLTECLAIAIYMGFSEIILLGMDLDQVFQLYSGYDREKLRFYGTSPIISNDSERNTEYESMRSGRDWLWYWTVWDQCSLLKLEAEKRGIKILNATNGGILNIFPRCNFDEILTNTNKL